MCMENLKTFLLWLVDLASPSHHRAAGADGGKDGRRGGHHEDPAGRGHRSARLLACRDHSGENVRFFLDSEGGSFIGVCVGSRW